MSRKKLLVAGSLALLAMHISVLLAQDRRVAVPNSTSVEEALSVFLAAFDNLDWPAFQRCFSRDATIFHPSAPNVRRIDKPEQFEKAWLGVFERIEQSSGRHAPPYMNLKPLDLRIEKLSDDVTLVTFHLIDGDILNRRTIVFKRETNGWKIVHIHASNLAAPWK